MKYALINALVALTLTVCGGLARAEEGWAISKLWPFGAKPAAKKNSRVSPGIPKLYGTPKSNPAAHQPSLLDKMTSGTKKAWNSTTSLLTPTKKAPTRGRSKSKSPFSFGSWFKSKEKPVGPRSVNEFLAQPRLDP